MSCLDERVRRKVLSRGVWQQKPDVSRAEILHLRKKCLAIVWGVSKFRLNLAGKPFILQTDYQPLTFLNVAKFKNDRIMRWALALQGYDFTVNDIPGKDNVLADFLSRIVIDPDES